MRTMKTVHILINLPRRHCALPSAEYRNKLLPEKTYEKCVRTILCAAYTYNINSKVISTRPLTTNEVGFYAHKENQKQVI